ncbi:MAG: purine-nucleoside phosphorylase [Planctomycetota bacterium]|nr:purine-nucleoside phosphorylase [Planctomycetota bacterium]
MKSGQEQVAEATRYVRNIWSRRPRVGLILGTGLGGLVKQIDCEATISFAEIPCFPRSTALSHSGQLVAGKLAGCAVVAMQGRCHLYEGYSRAQVGLPVRMMHSLGIEVLVVSNASGGLDPRMESGDILVLQGHVDLMARGDANKSEATWTVPAAVGHRLRSPYDTVIAERALATARRAGFCARPGVYVAVTGPNYETRAEYRMLRQLGDAVGMSTVPEVLVAAECGIPVLALSVVTNVARPDALATTTGGEVVDLAEQAEPKLREIVLALLQQYEDPLDHVAV